MAVVCPIGFDADGLRAEVRSTYDRVAHEPDGNFHFHRGPAYAAELLGYDLAQLDTLPPAATASFAGVGNPLRIDAIRPGDRVVDVGCGAGMDLLLAARAVGATGRVIGVDMTDAMRERATASAKDAGLGARVEVRAGDAESLPVENASVDVVISNGVLNLTTDKNKAFSEIARVLVPGGRLLLADIVVEDELSEEIRGDVDLWAA
jgi:SAM-dependent methyltransferase